MYTVATLPVPGIGDSSATVAGLLGAPRQVESHGFGVVRWYVHNGEACTVLFNRNRACALLYPYGSGVLRRDDLALLTAHVATQSATAHMYIAETGLIIATPRCPRSAVEFLAGTTWV